MKKQFITLGIIALLSLSAFAQQSCGTVKDYDGNTYKTVQLGSQCWMAENLKTTHYSDGTSIPQGSDKFSTRGYWYYPDGKSGNKSIYGLLYEWKAVMRNSSSSSSVPSYVQGICPKGWHVPSDAEWTQLTDYVSDHRQYRCGGDAENIAKALASTEGWGRINEACCVGNNRSTNNATGFSAVLAGSYFNYRFENFGYGAFFWSATQSVTNFACYRCLYNDYAGVSNSRINMHYGFSVRCLRD